MPLDPEILKLRWGVTDAALDPLVEDTAATAQAMCESYTGRLFDLADEAEDFSGVVTSLQVKRYPLESVAAIWHWLTGQAPEDPPQGTGIAAYHMDKSAGLIWPGVNPCGWPGVLHVEYRGGYATWPADLKFAVTLAADVIWNATPGGGAPAGTPGEALGAYKKLSVVGAFSAELDTAGGGDAGGGSDGDNTWGILPPNVTSVLDRYRTAAVLGIG
jgi:hypothetical protein